MNRDALVGLVNGLPTTYGRVQPFVVTLATMSAAAGMALYITKGQHYRVAKTKVYVIAVVVIRGASLAGGVGSMGGAFVGLLIIGVLNNGLSLLHVNPNLQAVVIGVVILAAGLADRTGIKNRG